SVEDLSTHLAIMRIQFSGNETNLFTPEWVRRFFVFIAKRQTRDYFVDKLGRMTDKFPLADGSWGRLT
ncbi:hypothetical protein, partial [Brevibacillus sp. IT-7CA2]|uniref:hypothetical protein n=1 Tax=Brevibacillus sp. IT-7CA2 TaxID=3026436 RepID=UPI0039E1F43C